MASLSNDGGLRRIQVFVDGKRQAIRLGRKSLKYAERVRGHVEALETQKAGGGVLPPETAAWLGTIDGTLRERLVTLGLAAPAAAVKTLTILELIDKYKDRPKWRNKKPSTQTGYQYSFGHILVGLGPDTAIDAVTEAEAEDFRGYLLEKKPAGAGLALASGHRIVDAASMLFRFAVKSRLLAGNPFDEVHRGVVASSRRAFIDAATSKLVLDAMKDSQWQLLFALARWGGLRVPSEPRALRWGDIDWERERFTVTSSKTEHHGQEYATRVVPMFDPLPQLFADRFAEAGEGEEFVLPMMQHLDGSAYRNQLDRTVRKLKLDRWPRIFHNLRATRQTELEEIFPTHVVCSFLGNSPRVAHRHYLRTTEEHFAKAAQIAAQQRPEQSGNTTNAQGDCDAIPRDSSQCEESTRRDMKRLISERS